MYAKERIGEQAEQMHSIAWWYTERKKDVSRVHVHVQAVFSEAWVGSEPEYRHAGGDVFVFP